MKLFSFFSKTTPHQKAEEAFSMFTQVLDKVEEAKSGLWELYNKTGEQIKETEVEKQQRMAEYDAEISELASEREVAERKINQLNTLKKNVESLLVE